MYNQFFGLQEDAFSLTADPKFLYMTGRQRTALGGLTYALISRKRCILLTGEVGVGKTTLIAAALKSLPAERFQFSVIYNPTLSTDELLEAVLLGFGLKEIPASKAQRLGVLERFVTQWKDRGKISAVVIDEAQKLSMDALEQVRLLGNLDALQIAMVGQTELDKLLGRAEAQALKQRVALRLTLERLSGDETRRYISHRWAKAGGNPPAPFDDEAAGEVVRYSGGTPRLINIICDNALMLAFGEEQSSVCARHVQDAASNLGVAEHAEAYAEEEKTPRVARAGA